MDELRVSFILENEDPIDRAEIDLLRDIELRKLLSVRSPGARRSQKHIPGYFWMAQSNQQIWYESRLEMMILKAIDHEREVSAAVAQPFLLSFVHNGKKRRHVPDFLLVLKASGALLVNVTAQRRLAHARNRVNFQVCEELCERLGWEYLTRSEPSPIYAANINWLNGYRRTPWHLEKYRGELLQRTTARPTIREALRDLRPEALARPVLFHLMWKREIGFDRNEILSDDTQLWRET